VRGSARAVRVIVTRPREQAQAWVESLRARGVDAVALPLIDIAESPDRSALDAAWSTLLAADGPRAVMFVSANAVRAFWAGAPAGATWPGGVLAAAPGPGTAAALRAAGVPPACLVQPSADAPQFDSEHLWPELARHDWVGRRVLIVRGEAGRDWLAERWQAAGAQVEHVAAYRRQPPDWDADDQARLDAVQLDPASHAWLFSSAQAIRHLLERAGPGASWTAHTALATHPRIAEAARRAGFGRVVESAADVEGVAACLESADALRHPGP
jgi:uroporphyrinogen-III synthase